MPAADAESPSMPAGDAASPCWEQLSALLGREHDAAREADVETLVSLQVAKRKLLDDLKGQSVPDDVARSLHERAQLNVTLMRHLVQCLAGLVGERGDSTYDAQGQRGPQATGLTPRVRGAL